MASEPKSATPPPAPEASTSSVKLAAALVGWVLTAVFGSGWYWQYKSANLADLKERLSLRERTTQKFLDLLPLVGSGVSCQSPEQAAKVSALIGDLVEFERQLAILEKRPPRELRDLFHGLVRPCPPTGLTVR